MSLEIKIINTSLNPLPQYQTAQAAGLDLQANLAEDIVLLPMQRAMIGTGLSIELPQGYEAQIRPRSGLASKHGITIINSPGTIDSDYRGEIKICLVNLSDTSYRVKHGERIAQMVVAKHETVNLLEVKFLSDTERGSGGHGHTGQ